MSHEDQKSARRAPDRTRLSSDVPTADAAIRKLLADDLEQMSLRESACYIAGYVAGFANASGEILS